MPFFGQKAIVNYPGIPTQCNRCYVVGHLRPECNNQRRDWVAYITNYDELLKQHGDVESNSGPSTFGPSGKLSWAHIMPVVARSIVNSKD